MAKDKRIDWILLILILPGLLSALALGANRYRLETRSRNVELALDYLEIQNLSVASGTPIPAILEQFKAAGITGVAVSEDLLGDLVATGEVAYTRRASDVGPLTVLSMRDKRLAARVLDALRVRLAPGMISVPAGEDTPTTFVVRAAPATLNLIGLGLSPDSIRIVKRAGLDVVGRLQNHPALTEKAVDAAIDDMKRDDISRLICAGEESFGFRGLIPYAAKEIKAADRVYGSIEFAKQKGDARMCKELDSGFIRVHSVSSAEMAGMSPSDIIERFARAVKERNIRLCYVRLPATSGEDPVASNVAFVSVIRKQIEGAGYLMGAAEPLGTMSRPLPLMILIALSVAAGGVLLLGSLVSLSPVVRYGLLVLGFAGLAGLAVIGEMGRQLVALKAAFIFPTLGVLAFIGPYFFAEKGEKSPIGKAIALFVGTSAVTLCGALLIVGLTADRSYMVKVNQFVGIKAAHLMPLLVVMLFMAAGLPILGKPFSKVLEDAGRNIRKVVNHPMFVWHALAVMVAVGIIGVALLRTGNDPGVGVSGIELKFRAILDRVMTVRPRTKEFLIGHPALFLGIAFLLTRRRNWGLPLVALGMLGQVSLLNTFCHIHTPLALSMLRSFNGLVLGLVIGLMAWSIFGRWVKTDSPDKV